MPDNHLLPTEAERTRIVELTAKLKRSDLKFYCLSLPESPLYQNYLYTILMNHLLSTNDKQWKEQVVSAWGMGFAKIPEDRHEETIKVLRDILAGRNRSKRKSFLKQTGIAIFKTVRNLLIVSAIFYLFKSIMLNSPHDAVVLIATLAAAITGVVGIFVLFGSFSMSIGQDLDRINETRAMAAKSLLRKNELKAMPELLAGAVDKAWEVQNACRDTLHLFLPQITEANIDLMPANTETTLSKVITTTYDIEHGEVIVDYLEKFGQGDCADSVASHLRELSHDYGGSETELKEYSAKVRKILGVLYERKTQDITRQQLLRHSSLPLTQPDQLLRPAADAQTTPAEQLLRASHSEE